MNISQLKSQIEEFKQIRTRNSVTPESLGSLLMNITDCLEQLVEETHNNISQQQSLFQSNIISRLSQSETNINATLDNTSSTLQLIQEQANMNVLEIIVSVSKTEFQNKEVWSNVWNNMNNNIPAPITIAVIYENGKNVFFHPTSVRNAYIGLNSRNGSCELHVNENGTFSVSGTSLW